MGTNRSTWSSPSNSSNEPETSRFTPAWHQNTINNPGLPLVSHPNTSFPLSSPQYVQQHHFPYANPHQVVYPPQLYQQSVIPTSPTYTPVAPQPTYTQLHEPRGVDTVAPHPTPVFGVSTPVYTASLTALYPSPAAYGPPMSHVPGPSGATYGVPQGPPRTPQTRYMQPTSTASMRSPIIPEELPPPGSTGAMSNATTIAQFSCRWSHHGTQCPGSLEGEKNSVARHLRDYHDFVCDGEQVVCAWEHCGSTLQRRNVARHIVAFHLEVKVYCRYCHMPLSRQDANRKHEKSCTMRGDTTRSSGRSEQL
ncbi:hypothetical protein J3A83DRAFT_2719246 [Scleroderma citrinum]